MQSKNKKRKRLGLLLCALVSAVITGGFANSARAQKNAPMVAVHDLDDDEAPESYQNVKEVHIYVCNYRWGEGLPNLLKPEALAREELKYVEAFIADRPDNNQIKFADGKKHEPIVTTEQTCEALYDPAMDEPGNLSFIVKVSPMYLTNAPHNGPPPFAILTHFLYRPDHKNSIAPVLRAPPLYIGNLTADEETLRREINLSGVAGNY